MRTNPIEAQAVVDEIIRRFAADPIGTPSIGVVTFNIQQRTLIESMLRDSGDERLIEALDGPADGAGRRAPTAHEGLFVKNLENVQGDERDVILFSTAFSVNSRGSLPLNFGPLNRAGGERRLNVAITRARRQVIVFSSFDPAQLRAEETSSVGVKHLRAYLDLAQQGPRALGPLPAGQRLRITDRHREEIAEALRQRGFAVQTEVGLSDFTIDLVVAPGDQPGRSGAGGAAGRPGVGGPPDRRRPGRPARRGAVQVDALAGRAAGLAAGVARRSGRCAGPTVRGRAGRGAAPRRNERRQRSERPRQEAADAGPQKHPRWCRQLQSMQRTSGRPPSQPGHRSASDSVTSLSWPSCRPRRVGRSPRAPPVRPNLRRLQAKQLSPLGFPAPSGRETCSTGCRRRESANASTRPWSARSRPRDPSSSTGWSGSSAAGFGLHRVVAARHAAILAVLPAGLNPDPVAPEFVWPPSLDPLTWQGFRRTPDGVERSAGTDQPAGDRQRDGRALRRRRRDDRRINSGPGTLEVFGFTRRSAAQVARLEAALELLLASGRLTRRPDGVLTP